ncbi:hypothetical protein F5Y19DRAFT_442861 [Xylariaceae sp. FL1651]|nr:hypothetical protein F5Y19DRAFT_442861 [Xylariaceae sp. FL1651]
MDKNLAAFLIDSYLDALTPIVPTIYTSEFIMDWGDNSLRFAQSDDFLCDKPPKLGNGFCEVERNYQYTRKVDAEQNREEKVTVTDSFVLDSDNWDKWVQEHLNLHCSPMNGYCILFIPRAADAEGFDKPVPSYFTSLPISRDKWDEISSSLYIPGHYARVIERGVSSVVSISHTHNGANHQGRQWKQVGTTTPTAIKGFAFASTHFESRRFTYAVMVGCSDDQIVNVKRLVSLFRDSNEHPLLMLGIFAELELRRLEDLIRLQKKDYIDLKARLDGEPHIQNAPQFSWDMIQEVLKTRDKFQDIEEEVEIAKRQLEKVCIRQADLLREEYEKYKNGHAEETNLKVSQLFSERFHDILSRLDGLSAQCRLRVESISFWTELIRSELARQEAKKTAQNTRVGTLIALVALVYLPITGVATVLGMPIFGWMNDWKNLSFQSVINNGQSSGSLPNSGSAGATGTGLPVVSGYIWPYALFFNAYSNYTTA